MPLLSIRSAVPKPDAAYFAEQYCHRKRQGLLLRALLGDISTLNAKQRRKKLKKLPLKPFHFLWIASRMSLQNRYFSPDPFGLPNGWIFA